MRSASGRGPGTFGSARSPPTANCQGASITFAAARKKRLASPSSPPASAGSRLISKQEVPPREAMQPFIAPALTVREAIADYRAYRLAPLGERGDLIDAHCA